MKDSQLAVKVMLSSPKYIKVNNERFSTATGFVGAGI